MREFGFGSADIAKAIDVPKGRVDNYLCTIRGALTDFELVSACKFLQINISLDITLSQDDSGDVFGA